mmetsp:Transcript_7947/g.12001  ORF Transcript_7947/g.12001 Transcript_7947/m.12001 type:complete len:203 (-) Transcript_7947:1314-1922(-)
MSKDGNLGISLDILHKCIPSSWNDQINDIIQCQHILNLIPTRDQTNNLPSNLALTPIFNRIPNNLMQSFIRMRGLLSTLEKESISTRQRQCRNLRHGIRPRFKDDHEYTNWHSKLIQNQPLCQFPLGLDDTQGIRLISNLSNPHCEGIQFRLIEFETIDELSVGIVTSGLIQVYTVCKKDFFLAFNECCCDSVEDITALLVG